MNIIKLTNDPQYKSPAGVQKVPTPDGSEAWVAHVNLGRVGDQEIDAVIIAEGTHEYMAITRLQERCKAWSTLLSMGMSEVFTPRIARIEKELTEEVMRQAGIQLDAGKPVTKLGGN